MRTLKTEAVKSIGKKRDFVIGTKTYVIKKMYVGKYAQLLNILEKLPAKIMEIYPEQNLTEMSDTLNSMSVEDMVRYLPKMMQFAATEVITAVSIATGIPSDILEGSDETPDDEIIGLDEFLELVEIIIDLNNLGKVADQIKNLVALKSRI